MEPPTSTRDLPAAVRRRLRADRRAARVVVAGGIGIIACVLGIVLFLVFEAAPLLSGAEVTAIGAAPLEHEARAVLVDDLTSYVVGADASGGVVAVRVADGAVVARGRIVTDGSALPLVSVESHSHAGWLAGAGSDGRVHVQAVAWREGFDGNARTVTPELEPPATLQLDPEQRPLRAWTASRDPDGQLAAAAQLADGTLAIVRRLVERNDFTGEVSFRDLRAAVTVSATLRVLCLDRAQANLYGASASGRLFWWRLGESTIDEPRIAAGPPAPVTAMRLLLGDQSLIVGTEAGTLSQWSPVRDHGVLALRAIREFDPLAGAVVGLSMSGRSKAFAALGEGGELALLFGTTGQRRWSADAGAGAVRAIAMGPRGDSLIAAGAGSATVYRVDDPHPEATARNLLLPIWYENYDAPTLTWQSTPSTDGGEPKLSLTPLIWGTLKATVFCLLFSVPVAVLAALFVSQFVQQRLRGWLKPAVELMAAVPSVVLGFVAAVWLAPQLEHALPGLLLAAVLAPVVVAIAGAQVRRLPLAWRGGWPAGVELVPIAVLVVATTAVCFALAPWLEEALLGSSFPDWVRNTLGLDFDQKNSVVVAIAMAVAVIPIVFSIAEEAFTNVPRSLVSASLALGADRWVTAIRVVVPAASAGVFSAIMIGFGRAIGETMIVLMAVGATPIIDFNPFTGFRTLSANVAIEIPEAPHGGTLYRVLFLAALLLLVLTFIVNTVAESVRTRLRRRHALL